MKHIKRVMAWVQLGRPLFLGGGFVLHGLGVVMAIYAGAGLNVAALLWGQLAITATQLMTHYANDYFDLQADRLNQTPTNWSGGSRVLPDGMLPPRTALVTAMILAGVALGANVVLSTVIRPGLGTFALLFVAQFLAWFYSAPPLRLHSRGVGEVATAVIVPLLTPLTGYYLQAGELAILPFLAVIPLCFYQAAMLLAIEFPDAVGDALGGKHTLVVRLGAPAAARLYSAALLLALLILPPLWRAGLPLLVVLAAGVWFPLILWRVWRVYRGDWREPERWNQLGFYSIVLLMGIALAELATFVLLIGTR